MLVKVEGEKELTLFDPFHNEKLYEAHIQEANLKFDPQSKLFTRQGLQHSTSIVMSPVDIQRPNFVASIPKHPSISKLEIAIIKPLLFSVKQPIVRNVITFPGSYVLRVIIDFLVDKGR